MTNNLFKDNLPDDEDSKNAQDPEDSTQFSRYDYKDVDKESNHQKINEIKVKSWIKIGSFALIAIIAFAYAIIYTLHALIPVEKRWLNPQDLADIKNFVVSIVSGVLTAVVLSYFYDRR